MDYTDSSTGIRFVEDDRGNYHLVPPDITVNPYPQSQNISISLESNESTANMNKRLRRILEKLRMENNWLWEILETAIRDGKKNPKQALANLEKSIKEKSK